MKKLLIRYYPAIPVAILLVTSMFSHSCANTGSGHPTGGLKDSLPPVLQAVYPQPNATLVPVTGQEFIFKFDENVVVKDASLIYLSPPVQKIPKTKIKEKTLIVRFEDTLKTNTTYTLSLAGAVSDNNEGNIFPGYTFVFSTGEVIDSMFICGMVQNNEDLVPQKGATILLYKDMRDSAVFLSKPYASAKSDDWGFFRIRNIQDTLYRLYAIDDLNNNSIYDPESESIAFVDSLIRPVKVVDDKLPELRNYDMKDTVRCRQRHPEYELNLFREKPVIQYIKNSGRTSDRACFISFMARNVHIDTMWVKGVPSNRLISQINRERDSLEFWINQTRPMPDTFHVHITYRKPDSLGVIVPFSEHLRLVNPHPRGRKRYISKTELKHEDTICVFNIDKNEKKMEREGILVEFAQPLISSDLGAIKAVSINPKQKEAALEFDFEPDSLNLRKYAIKIKEPFKAGFEYTFKIPQNTFRDICGFGNDSTEIKVKLPVDEKFSKLTLNLTGVKTKYIIDLLDNSKKKSFGNYIVEQDGAIVFPYLDAATYYIRFIEDRNRNSLVDGGNVLKMIPPERTKFYKPDGEFAEFKIPAGVEISQDINVNKMFE